MESKPAIKQSARYAIRLATTAEDRAAILALWGQAFPAPQQHPIKYDWCYSQTPQGQGRLYVMSADDGAVIGVQGIVPRHWWHNGVQLNAGIYADLVVDPQYRSAGPALSLVRGVVERERNEPRTALLYGFPNKKSEALLRRAGYRRLAEITRYARPLRLHVWLKRLGLPSLMARLLGVLIDRGGQLRLLLGGVLSAQGRRSVPLTGFDKRFDALWQRVAANGVPMVIRDSAFLQWRFSNNFSGTSHILGLEAGDGRLDGYVVYIETDDNMVSVLDFLAVDEVALRSLLQSLLRRAYLKGCNGVTLEFNGPPAMVESLRQCRFIARESHPIYYIGHEKQIPETADMPYFTAGDRDQ